MSFDEIPVLPAALEVEKSVLATLLGRGQGEEIMHSILTELVETDFYSPLCQEVFRAATELYREKKPITEAFLIEKCRRYSEAPTRVSDFLDGLGWLDSGSRHIADSINLLRQYGQHRAMVIGLHEILAESVSNPDAKLVEQVQALAIEVSRRQAGQTEALIGDVLPMAYQELEERYNAGKTIQGLSTGFPRLDALTGGFQKTRLIVLCARTGCGKTSIALQLASHVALNERKPVFYASMEMSKTELASRAVCQVERLDTTKLRNQVPDAELFQRFSLGMATLSSSLLVIDDAPQTLSRIRTKAKRVIAKHGELGLVCIDYLGLVRPDSGRGAQKSRYEAVSEIVRGLKDLALDLQVPVLCLAQPNRGVDQRNDNDLRLSDLKDSGEIEQAADLVLFLNRTETEKTILKAAKQRNGPLGEVVLNFSDSTTSFREAW